MTSQLLNIILWIVFSLIIVSSLLAGLIGFLKGIYKTTLKTIIKTILIIVFLFTTPSIANSIGNINLSNFNVNFQIKNTDIKLTTIQQTLADILSATGFITPINGLSLYETSISISTSLLSYAVFFISCLLIQIFASLITSIIYNGIFKWFLPVENKEDRKKRKDDKNLYELTSGIVSDNDEQTLIEGKKKLKLLKIPSLFLGITQEFIFLCVLISPLSSLSRVVVKNQDNISYILNLANIDDTKMKEYTTIINNSPLYNMLGVLNFDTTILNTASNVVINGQNVSFEKLINSTFDIAKPLISSDCISYDSALGQVTVNFSYLLSKNMISTLTEKVILNNILIALIPPLIDIGINSVSSPNFTMPKIDFTNINWSNELSAINNLYSQVYDTGIISQFISSDNKSLTSSNFIMKCSDFTDDDIKNYASIFKSASSLDIVKLNSSKIMAGFGSLLNSQGLNILPSEEKEYENVNWEEDMSIFAESLFKGLRALQLDITFNMSTSQVQEKILETLQDPSRREVFKLAVIGSDESKGLLDTSFFKIMNLSKIMSSSLESIPELKGYIQSIDFAEIFADMSVEQIKEEFVSMFEVVEKLFDNNDIIDISKLQNIDLKDPKTDEILSDILLSSQKSKIFNYLFPSIMKNLLHKNNFNFSTYFYGITPYDLNYDASDFTSTIQQVISKLPDVYSMLDNISNYTSKQDKLNAIDTSLLRKWLNIMVNSDSFNPDSNNGIYNVSSKNIVIHKFINNLLSSDALSFINYKKINLEDMQNISWGEGIIGDGGEIDLICSTIEELKTNSSFFLSEKDNKFEDIKDYESIDNLFHYGLKSIIFSDTILYQINTSLEIYFNKINVPININKLRTSIWLKKDENNLDDINRLVLSLRLLDGTDLYSINLLKMDEDKINSIFTLFSESNFITLGIDNFSDSFGYFLFNLINNDSISEVNYDIDISTFNSSINNYNWCESTIRNGYSLTFDDKTSYFPITNKGAIKDASTLIQVIKEIGIDNLKDYKLPTDDSYIDKISSLKDGTYYKSNFIKCIYSQILKQSIYKFNISSTYTYFKNYIDFSLICEKEFINLKNEIVLFKHLYRLTLSNNFELIFNDLKGIKNNGLFDEFSLLLNEMADSEIMLIKQENREFSPISYLLYISNIQNNFTNIMTLNNDNNSSLLTVKGILNSVNDYQRELKVNIPRVIQAMQEIDLNNFSIIGESNLTYNQILELITALNQSSIYHRVSISFLKDDLSNKDFDKLLKDPDTNVLHSFNFMVHLDGNDNEDILYWQNDYDLFVDMIFNDKVFSSFIKNNSLIDAKFNNNSFSTSFIYYISEMNLFKNNRSYFLYNLILQTVGDNSLVSSLFIDSLNTPYFENSKVYRLEDLFFNNEDINVMNKEIRKEYKLFDLSLLDNVLKKVISNLKTFTNATSINELKLDSHADGYENLIINNCLTNKKIYGSSNNFSNKTYRCKLTSEIMASYFTVLKNKNLLFDSSLNFYENNYFLINPIEARAIDGLILISDTLKNSSNNYVTHLQMKSGLLKLGMSYNYYLDDEKKIIFNFNDENSICKELINNNYLIDANNIKYNSIISKSNMTIDYIFSMYVSDLNNNIIKLNEITSYQYIFENKYSYTDFYYSYLFSNIK